jgi:Na+-driven multidrug efflux pump
LPAWVRGLVLVIGLCGVAGLAWAAFFAMLLGTAVIGVWLIAQARSAPTPSLAARPAA